jgi:hypothetical protein
VLWLRLWLCSERYKVKTVTTATARACMKSRTGVRNMIRLALELGIGLLLVLD